MPNPSFYWDGSFIYGYYQWEEKWENGDEQILDVFKFTWKTSTMCLKVLVKSHYDNYLCYSKAVVDILSLFISTFSYLAPVDIQLSGIFPGF